MHFKDLHLNGNCCMSAGWQKCHTKRCLELQNNGPGHMTFVVWPTCLPVYYCGYIYVSLSGFLIMHPDLVLLTLFSCNEALLSHVPSVSLS